MSDWLELGVNAKAVNLRFRQSAIDGAILMTGNKSWAERIKFTGGTTYVNGHIQMVGDDCHVSNVQGRLSAYAIVVATGDRPIITQITSEGGAAGCAVRLDGGVGAVVSDVQSSNDDSGVIIDGASLFSVKGVHVQTCDASGVVVTDSDNGIIEAVVVGAGQHGIHITDSDRNRISGQVVDASLDTTNTSDGVLVDGTSTANRTALTVTYRGAGNQMRYGMNLGASVVDHVEASILSSSGATANFNDAGAGTVLTDDHIV